MGVLWCEIIDLSPPSISISNKLAQIHVLSKRKSEFVDLMQASVVVVAEETEQSDWRQCWNNEIDGIEIIDSPEIVVAGWLIGLVINLSLGVGSHSVTCELLLMLTSNINPPDVFYVQLEQLDVGGASGFQNLILIYWT